MNPPPFNAADVRRTLEIFCGGSVAEVRIINAFGSKSRTDAGYFSRYEIAAGAIAGHAIHPKNSGIYFVLNEFPADLQNRANNRIAERIDSTAADADITRRRWFFIDCDPKRPAGISSSEAEWLAARATADAVAAFLASRAFPAPILASSGNGWHLHYRIDVPNNEEATETIRNALREIANRFDNGSVKIDTKVFNAARVCKLYGTVSRKGDHSPERPHRVSELVKVPETIHVCDWSKIEALAAEAPKGKTKTTRERGKTRPRKSVVDRAAAYLAKIPPAVSGESGHDTTFHAACVLVRDFDLSIEDALPILAEWNERCVPPWSDRELLHKLQDADRAPGERGRALQSDRWEVEPIPRSAAGGGVGADNDLFRAAELRRRGIIEIHATDERATTDGAISLMNSEHDLFDSNGKLVQVLHDSAGELVIHPLSKESLREIVSTRVKFIVAGAEFSELRQVPRYVPENVLKRPFWPSVPGLRKVLFAPFLTSAGEVVDTPGFDRKSGVFAEFNSSEWPNIHGRLTQADAVNVASRIEDLMSDFPWQSPVDFSAWFALLLSIPGRDFLPGPIPAFVADAAAPGSGKSMLLSIAHEIGTQSSVSMTAMPDNSAELTKKLVAILCRNPRPQMVVFDNCSRVLGGDVLESYLTSTKFSERILGVSQEVNVASDCILTFSGNGVRVRPDFARRMLRFRLVPQCANPENRSDFKIADLMKYVRENKRQLLVDVLSLWSSWCHAGGPEARISPWGSFTAFDRVRHLLRWLGYPDPAENNQLVRREVDTRGAAEEAFLEVVVVRWGRDRFTAAELLKMAGENAELREAVEALMEPRQLRELSAIQLGKRLSKLRDRVFPAGKQLTQHEGRGRRVYFAVAGGFGEGGGGGEGVSANSREGIEFAFT